MNNYPNLQKNFNSSVSNYNFNKCGYIQNNPSNIYDSYAGFIRGNMFPDLYNTYKLSKPYDIEPMNEQAEILTYLDALSFACIDLNLYLDNFPENEKIVNLYKQYAEEKEKTLKTYENKYGPLFSSEAANNYNSWAWDKCPWPWENR